MRREIKLATLIGGVRGGGVGRRGEEGEERVVDVDGEAADGDDVDSQVELGPVRVGGR